jgi:hypothetical protein
MRGGEARHGNPALDRSRDLSSLARARERERERERETLKRSESIPRRIRRFSINGQLPRRDIESSPFARCFPLLSSCDTRGCTFIARHLHPAHRTAPRPHFLPPPCTPHVFIARSHARRNAHRKAPNTSVKRTGDCFYPIDDD